MTAGGEFPAPLCVGTPRPVHNGRQKSEKSGLIRAVTLNPCQIITYKNMDIVRS
jgi:hypothetical protein